MNPKSFWSFEKDRRRIYCFFFAFAIFAILLSIPKTYGVHGESTILTAYRTNETITVDGIDNETSWAKAKTLKIVVKDGSIGTVDVISRALYDKDYIYLHFTWEDATESIETTKWRYSSIDKNWTFSGDEDRLAIFWNINDSISGFNIGGCAMVCHGDRIHTNRPGERGDSWHWKASRTNPLGYSDDKYIDNNLELYLEYYPVVSWVGRHGDAGVVAYLRNINENNTGPKYYEPNPVDASDAKFIFQWEIDDGEAIEIDNSKTFRDGFAVPGYILQRPSGSRGDIDAKGVWEDGRWSLEIRRKLTTGHDDDVQFDITKTYRFGLAISDNAGGFEGHGKGHSFDLGARTLEFGGLGSEEVTQLALIRDYLLTAKVYVERGESGLAISEIDHAFALYNEIGDAVANKSPTHYIKIKSGFMDSERKPSTDNINALIKDIDDMQLIFQGKREPDEASWKLKFIAAWGNVQIYVFILLALLALFPMRRTIQIGKKTEFRGLTDFLIIIIIPIILEGLGRIGIITGIRFLQNFSFMTNEYATLLWAGLMAIALYKARGGFGVIDETIQSMKLYSVKLEKEVVEREKVEQQLKGYAKQLKRSNELKDLFTDILRHDLLNPIGIIRNYAELALVNESDAEKLEELQAIKRNAEKAIKLVENATEYSRLESLEKLDFEKLDLNAVFKEVVKDVSSMLQERNMRIEYKVKGRYPARANPVIKSVFSNLMSNAIKYSPGGSRIVIRIEDENKNWKVSVKDYGEGIPDENKEVIFERFVKGGKKGVKGTGLGLAIVKRTVELHKGKVWVEDNPEGGSIFYVSIPKWKA